MCGLAGIVLLSPDAGAPPEPGRLERMAAAMRHRGPNEFGCYRDRLAGLAHARLSIIDLSSGQQPLSNEDSTLWIVFNGEIFNYIELRQDLEKAGHRFRTQSDTEVIVHSFEEWGEDAFPRFNGQFAIALWDARKKRLILARDLAGICPLYFCEQKDRVIFGSEVKAIFAGDPSMARRFDPVGLHETFTFWSVVPPQGVFQGISELVPGHVRVYSQGKVCDKPFWSPKYPRSPEEGFPGTFDEAVEEVRAALIEATRLRMVRADVPVGSYLSGGLDSSLVAAMGLDTKGEKYQTFSLRFEDAEYDESPFQQEMVAHIGSDHHEVIVSRADIAYAFKDVVRFTERPILRTAPTPLFLLSRLVNQSDMRVVLTGEGADEVFAGYDIFREAKVRRFWARQPQSTWRPLLLERLYPYLARSPVSQRSFAKSFFGRNLEKWDMPGFSHDLRWETTATLLRFFTPSMRRTAQTLNVTDRLLSNLPGDYKNWSYLAQDQYMEIRTLLAGYLLSSQGDRMLMAHSVEGRFPFLDINVIELANSLPAKFKLHGLDEKHIVKQAAKGVVPDSILTRKKQPYRAPDALAFVISEAPSWVEEMMNEKAVGEAGVFEPKTVSALWKKCKTRAKAGQFSNTDNMAVVGILSTQLLHQEFIRKYPEPGPTIEMGTVVDCLSD